VIPSAAGTTIVVITGVITDSRTTHIGVAGR
jgi:hypothetical protein